MDSEMHIQEGESQHLGEAELRERRLQELSLVPYSGTLYQISPEKAAKRGGSTKRMAANRERDAAAGLVNSLVPVLLVEQVKQAGGWAAIDSAVLSIGRQVSQLRGWRRWLVMLVIRI